MVRGIVGGELVDVTDGGAGLGLGGGVVAGDFELEWLPAGVSQNELCVDGVEQQGATAVGAQRVDRVRGGVLSVGVG